MADRPLIPILPVPIHLNHPIFHEICRWPFADSFVGRLLQDDIPRRIKFSKGRIWAYLDSSHALVGFGAVDVCNEYDLTGKKPHPYIPLLAVNPSTEGRGYGTSIVWHLIGEAALLASQPSIGCQDILFLDVYISSVKAIALYEKCGFVRLRDEPLFDPAEHKSYFVMSKRVSMQNA